MRPSAQTPLKFSIVYPSFSQKSSKIATPLFPNYRAYSQQSHKVAVTPANVTDAQGFDQVAPEPKGLSHADKGYCSNDGSPKGGFT